MFCPYLAMDVRNNHRVGPITHYKVIRSFRDENNIVNRDVRTLGYVWGFNCVGAIHCLHAPDLIKKTIEVIHKYKMHKVWKSGQTLTFTVPSADALITCWLSCEKITSFM